MQIFVNPNYNFLKWRFHAMAFSLVFILAGAVLYMRNGVNLGIDFAGGANVILKFQSDPPIDQLRTIVSDASIQQYGKPADNSVLIRLPQQKREGDYAGEVVVLLKQAINGDQGARLDLNFQGRDSVAELLKAQDPDKKGTGPAAHDYYHKLAQAIIGKRSELGIFRNVAEVTSIPGLSKEVRSALEQNTVLGKFNLYSQETVGPQVGRELQTKAFWAVILSTIAMGIYIAVRFDLRFGVAAILCLVHDVAIALSFMAMINGEFEIITVAAFLMIVGYSINDTVVVYDRVRENVKKLRVKEDFETVLNRSLNQTLSRTILTGGCVVLVLLCLIVFGGEVINEFSWLLLVGIIAGTFSTLTVVPAIVLAWNRLGNSSPKGRAAAEVIRPEPTVEPRTKQRANG